MSGFACYQTVRIDPDRCSEQQRLLLAGNTEGWVREQRTTEVQVHIDAIRITLWLPRRALSNPLFR